MVLAEERKGSLSSREGQGGRVSEGGLSEGSAGTAVEAHLGSGYSRSDTGSKSSKAGSKES